MCRLILIICLLPGLAGCGIDIHVNDSGESPPGFTQVPPASKEGIAAADSLENWHNPFLVVHPDGITISKGAEYESPDRKTVAELERILVALPADAWPLGRVVAVTEQHILSGDDEQRIAILSVALTAMLETNEIQIERWPT